MPRFRVPFAISVGLAALLLSGEPFAAPARGGATQVAAPARGFVQRLARAGRAEARFSRTARDPLGGGASVTRGTLALEPPDRLSLAFGGRGERLVVRGDGGEWVQPDLEQVLTLDRERAAIARRWWAVLLGEDDAVTLTRTSGRRYRVVLRDAAEGEEAWVTFDANGLPVRLDVEELGGPSVYRFSGWRFIAARGPSAFRVRAPAGYTVVPLP